MKASEDAKRARVVANEVLEEVGKRVTKELLENTKDSTGMIESMEERV